MSVDNKKIQYFLIGILIAGGVVGGGFFVYISAALTIAMMLFYAVIIMKSRSIRIHVDSNMLAITLIPIMYLISSLWAVDSGMALMGFVKFMPVLLFALILTYMDQGREKIKRALPYIGALMTVFSVIFMKLPILDIYFQTAGRLSGFFQYPNTFAAFLLICLIILLHEDESEHKRIRALSLVILCVGIILTGSRIVFAITFLMIVLELILKTGIKKKTVVICGTVILAALCITMILNHQGVTHIASTNMSTLWGRLLYYADALPVILKHPFGMGFYGYYFTQSGFQTGVYNVVNIHNELLQFMLDVGWIPAVLLFTAMVKTLVNKEVCVRDKMVMLVILLHSMLDFDLQFMTMFFVMILFLNMGNVKEYDISSVTKSLIMIISVAAITVSARIGFSDFMFINQHSEEALDIYKGNTMAEISVIMSGKGNESMADDLINSVPKLYVGYSISADYSFSNGNLPDFMIKKDKVLEMAPYQYNEYEKYAQMMCYACEQFISDGDYSSARICMNKITEIRQKMAQAAEGTSSLAWKIDDKPVTDLSETTMSMIVELQRRVNN